MARLARAALALSTALWFAAPGTLVAAQPATPARRLAPPAASTTGVDSALIRAYLAEQAALSRELDTVTEKKVALETSIAAEKQAETDAAAKAAADAKAASKARYEQCTKGQEQCVRACEQADSSRRLGSAMSSLGSASAKTAAGLAMLDSLATASACKETCKASSCDSP